LRWLLVLLLVGCVPVEDEGATDAFCDEQPVLTWANFGQGYINHNCQSCHAEASPDRRDAPDDVTFDDQDDAVAMKPLILGVASREEPTMPPEGGVDDEDRLKMEIWLRCFEE
jgi:hypothetical protein